MRHPPHIKRKRVECPECGRVQSITWHAGVKRFKARLHSCIACGFTGRLGEFDKPSYVARD